MKKTNKKMIAILVSIIVVVAAFVVFEITAFAEEMNINEENIEMTVENENEQVIDTVENEEDTQEQETESKINAEFEFDFTFENDLELVVEPIEDFVDNQIYIELIDLSAENKAVEDEINNEESQEIVEDTDSKEETESKENIEAIKNTDNQEIKAFEYEEKAEEPAIIDDTTKDEEKDFEIAPEQEKEEINKCENKFYTEFANGVIVNTSTEANNISNDFAPVIDFTLNCVQDIDAFLVNEKRAIIA